MEPINAIARKYDIKVIEDATQAQGALYRDKRAGALGDAAGHSFIRAKFWCARRRWCCYHRRR